MKTVSPADLVPAGPSMDKSKNAITVTDLSKTFEGRMVLDRISCSIPVGKFVVLLGPSGCGKSTLFRCLTRLVEPDRGTVTIRGSEVTALKLKALRALRREVGFVFQQFNLVKRFSAIDNVLTARLAGTPLWRVLLRRFRYDDRQLALACLDSVGLLDQAYQRAERLSGGQQQRVAIARAFAQQTELILADEPISSLDPESSENVLQILQQAARERGFTVLCSLHQVELALRYADHIIALRQGNIFFDGPAEAFTSDLREELYRAA